MSYRRALKVVGLAIVVLAAARTSSAVPQYVYCCLYNCDLVQITDCPGGGWTSFDACNLHCQ